MTTQEFAQYHMIPMSYARAYEQGCEAARRNDSYQYPTTPSPQEGWFFAGYADTRNQIERGPQ